jgi:hypothetical protein
MNLPLYGLSDIENYHIDKNQPALFRWMRKIKQKIQHWQATAHAH